MLPAVLLCSFTFDLFGCISLCWTLQENNSETFRVCLAMKLHSLYDQLKQRKGRKGHLFGLSFQHTFGMRSSNPPPPPGESCLQAVLFWKESGLWCYVPAGALGKVVSSDFVQCHFVLVDFLSRTDGRPSTVSLLHLFVHSTYPSTKE